MINQIVIVVFNVSVDLISLLFCYAALNFRTISFRILSLLPLMYFSNHLLPALLRKLLEYEI